MAKKTIATLQKNIHQKMTKIIKVVKINNFNYSFEERIVPNNIVKDFILKNI